MNSFVYRHTYNVESPLCPRCRREEQTGFHVIWECNRHSEEIQQVMREIVGEEEVHQADYITLLNCSRDRRFISLCLEVLREQEGDFLREIELNL